jgi:hypothetical protein
MKKKSLISVFIVIIAAISLLVVVVGLVMHPSIPGPTLPEGTYQGTLSSASPPQLAESETNASDGLVWAITISSSVYSGLSLPNGTVIYVASSTNITSYSDLIKDLSPLVSDGLSAPTFANALPEVVSFSGTIFTFRDINDHLCYGLDNAKLMPPAPQPA